MISAKVILFKYKTLKDGTHPIVLQLIKDRKRKIVSLGYTATPHQWDSKNNLPNKKHPNSGDIEKVILKKRYQAVKAISELEDSGKPFTMDDIFNKINNYQRSNFVFEYTEALI